MLWYVGLGIGSSDDINGISLGICFVPVRVRNRSGAFVISKARNRGRAAWVILGCPTFGPIRQCGCGRNQ